jgi:hypothetical protein
MRVSPHTAQASKKGLPYWDSRKPEAYFTLLPDRQNSFKHTERTIRRRHLLSLLSSDSIRFHVIRDPLNVCLLTESRTWQDIPAIIAGHSLLSASYSSPPTACLAVSLPKGRRDWVPTFHIVDPVDDLGVPSTPVVLRFRAGS